MSNRDERSLRELREAQNRKDELARIERNAQIRENKRREDEIRKRRGK